MKYSSVFPEDVPNGLPDNRPIDHKIETQPGAPAPARAAYRLSPAELTEIKRQLDDLIAKGWIRPSSSTYSAPLLLAPKPGGKWRKCTDYRALNQITIKNKYPLPRIDDLLDQLGGAKYFTKIDLRSAYHQVRIAEADIHKTTNTKNNNHNKKQNKPKKHTKTPATFMRLMNDILFEYLY